MHESAQTASDQSLYLVVSRSGETLTNPDGTVHYVRVLPRTLAEEGAVLGRTVLRPNPVLEPDLIPGFNAREGARDEHTPATAAPAAGTPTAEVHALYCEDDALQAVAAELNAAEPNSQEAVSYTHLDVYKRQLPVSRQVECVYGTAASRLITP